MFLYKNTFVLTFLKSVKKHKNVKKKFFSTHVQQICNKRMIHKSNYAPFFTKDLIETNWKFEKFRLNLNSFSAIKETVTGVGEVFSILSLFSSIHVIFQFKLNSYRSLFIMTVNIFSSIVVSFFLIYKILWQLNDFWNLFVDEVYLKNKQ